MTPLPDLIHLNNIVGKTKGIAPGFVHQDLVLKILESGLFIFLKTATKVYLLNLNIDISSINYLCKFFFQFLRPLCGRVNIIVGCLLNC